MVLIHIVLGFDIDYEKSAGKWCR